jgi:hypothetical protein
MASLTSVSPAYPYYQYPPSNAMMQHPSGSCLTLGGTLDFQQQHPMAPHHHPMGAPMGPTPEVQQLLQLMMVQKKELDALKQAQQQQQLGGLQEPNHGMRGDRKAGACRERKAPAAKLPGPFDNHLAYYKTSEERRRFLCSVITKTNQILIPWKTKKDKDSKDKRPYDPKQESKARKKFPSFRKNISVLCAYNISKRDIGMFAKYPQKTFLYSSEFKGNTRVLEEQLSADILDSQEWTDGGKYQLRDVVARFYTAPGWVTKTETESGGPWSVNKDGSIQGNFKGGVYIEFYKILCQIGFKFPDRAGVASAKVATTASSGAKRAATHGGGEEEEEEATHGGGGGGGEEDKDTGHGISLMVLKNNKHRL